MFNENRDPRALQRSLDRHAKVSEDSDRVNQMLRPYDGDIQVAVSVVGSDGDTRQIVVKWLDRGDET